MTDLTDYPGIAIEPEIIKEVANYHMKHIRKSYNRMTGKSAPLEEALSFFDKYYDRLPEDLQESVDFFGRI
jgi:hypothetical protein